jgi:predicted kinase
LKPRIILAVGLPGSGKSTYFANLGAHAISSDAIRLHLADDESDQTIHARVFATMRYLLKQRIELGRPVTYVDATNLTRRDRRPFIKLAQKHVCDIEALFFDIPLEVCKVRNSSRSRLVPDQVLDRMAAKLTPPSLEEGFSVVTVMSAEVVQYLP